MNGDGIRSIWGSAERLEKPPWLAVTILAIGILLPGSAFGATAQTMGAAMVQFAGNNLSGKDGPQAKMGLDLILLQQEHNAAAAQGQAAAFQPSNPNLQVEGGQVLVEIVAVEDAAAMQVELEALGMQVTGRVGRMVSGWLPTDAIDGVAALSSVRFGSPSFRPERNVGATTSQGDQAMGSDDVRNLLGFDGTGVTVGVLSDSYDKLGGAAGDVATGDLPAGVNVILDSALASDTDEGRAMLQLVHDVAPGAGLAFATANGGQPAFAANILASAAAADVVVDDVMYFAEPMFQDGIIAQAADSVFGLGKPYFSAAGNQSRLAYSTGFNPGGAFLPLAFPSAGGAPSFLGGTAHDFDPGAGVDVFQQITLPATPAAGRSFTLALQWDSPFFSVSGPPGSPNDLDVYIFNDPPTTVLAGSINVNVGADAVEVVGFTYTSAAPVNLNIMITKFSGANPGLLKYVIFRSGSTINQFATNSGTLYGHANAIGAEAVGAAFYFQTPAFGTAPPVLEAFSSAGTTPILFNTLGAPIFDARAVKPEIVAPDGTNNTFFGSDIPDPGDGSDLDTFPNFFGTSAAAPHAAAVAALMLQAAPLTPPAAIYGAQEGTAIDMGPAGFDNDSGFGLIYAWSAVCGLLPSCPFAPLSPFAQHYLCYKPKVLSGPSSQGSHTVIDQFGTTNAEAKQAGLFCNPASKDGSPLPRPDDHLKCYKYKWKWPAPFVRHTSNQFGIEQLALQKSKFLCVPTQKSPPGFPVSPNEQHYLCYTPKLLAGAKSQGIHTVVDQFGSSTGEVKKVGLFCNPAQKDIDPIVRPNDHLQCYKYKLKLPAPITVNAVNQFGTETLSLQKTKFLCVPTEKE